MIITDYFMIAALVIILAYDVVIVLINGGNVELSISRRLYKWAKVWPIIPFAAGMLMGHLFAPNCAVN